MKSIPFHERLAVCSWSLQPGSPEELVAKLRQIGVPRVQLALDPVREQPQVWGRVEHTLRAAGFDIVSGMIGFVGEDYTTMESIHATGGVTDQDMGHAQGLHHAHGKGDLLGAVALIKVEAALHGHHVLAAQGAEMQLAVVAFHRALRHVRDGIVIDHGFGFDLFDQSP